MINITDKAAEALGEPRVASCWRQADEIVKDIESLLKVVQICNEKSFLKGANADLEDAKRLVQNVSIRASMLLETGYRLLPPETRNCF